MRIPILACLAIASSAAAQPQPIVAAVERGVPIEPAKIRLGAIEGGTVTYFSVSARNHPEHVHVTLTFAMATRSKTAREVAIPIGLSSQVAAVGLGLHSAQGKEVGLTMDAEDARSTYQGIVYYLKDPALLEQRIPGWLGLFVYPVSRDAPATVTVELSVPYGAPLVLDHGKSGIREVAIDLGGETQRRRLAGRLTVSLVDALEVTPGEPEAVLPVDEKTSLIARPEESRSRTGDGWSALSRSSYFRPHEQTLPTNTDWLSDRDIAKAVDLRKEPLGRCFALGEERSASLMISIDSNGAVTSLSVDDLEHEPSRTCISREIAAWKFAAFRRSRTLRYALEL